MWECVTRLCRGDGEDEEDEEAVGGGADASRSSSNNFGGSMRGAGEQPASKQASRGPVLLGAGVGGVGAE